ncbi:GAF and ANTAR domain-containing protein [Pseudonocardia sp. NPDC049154]|uniref:GAF and ANTAR domain-containing protein n=1 Tax=Pseudonocardia sp. NPDC049154 TaxID=3155501 RepID=UPI0033FFC29B
MTELGAVTTRLTRLVAHDLDEEQLARRVCEACVEYLDVDGAAISVLTAEASRRTLWATDETALRLEEIQATLNEGACVEAARSGSPVLVGDLTEAAEQVRWPVFASEVAERTPVRALFALPLRWGAVTIGVMDLYRLRTGTFPLGQWQDLLATAEIAGLLLLGVRTRPGNGVRGDGNGALVVDAEHDGWLSDGVFGRPEIHQAAGMVLVQLGIGPEEALARMRARAFAEQRLLIDVARDVVERRLVFTEEAR